VLNIQTEFDIPNKFNISEAAKRAEFRFQRKQPTGCFEVRTTPEIGGSFAARQTPCKAKLMKISQPERLARGEQNCDSRLSLNVIATT